MVLVSDVVARKPRGGFVATVPPDMIVADLLGELDDKNVGALVVSTDGVTVAGIVSERDVVRKLRTFGLDLLQSRVDEIMTAQVEVASPTDSLETIMQLMTERRIRHVPVVSTDGVLAGLISIGD